MPGVAAGLGPRGDECATGSFMEPACGCAAELWSPVTRRHLAMRGTGLLAFTLEVGAPLDVATHVTPAALPVLLGTAVTLLPPPHRRPESVRTDCGMAATELTEQPRESAPVHTRALRGPRIGGADGIRHTCSLAPKREDTALALALNFLGVSARSAGAVLPELPEADSCSSEAVVTA